MRLGIYNSWFIGMLTFAVNIAAGVVYAEELAPPPAWLCERCAAPVGWQLDIKAGPAYVSGDAFEFGDYTGFDAQGFYLPGNAFALYRDDDRNYFSFDGFAYSAESMVLSLAGGRQGVYELRAAYQALPRRIFASTTTPYLGTGDAALTLPAGWVRAPNTQSMTSLATTLMPVKIEWDWDVYKFGVDYAPATSWKLRADYRRTEREGQRRISGSFGFSAAEFTQPVEYSSDDLELEVAYGSDRWQTSLTYFGSVFSNNNESLQWANAFSSGLGADGGELALAPDNESHQLSLAGSLLLPLRSTLNGQLSYGHMTQNERLLPYTTNNLITTGPLPVGSAQAEVNTLNVNLRAVTSPTRQLTFEGELRYNDFDNQTPVNSYAYVNTDSVLAAYSARNSAYDYERRDLRLRGEYRLNSQLKFEGGLNTERFERNRQDRTRTTTERVWLGLRSRLGKTADVNIEGFAEDRGGSDYATVVNPAAQENPLMRKYNMADRERAGVRLSGSSYRIEGVDFGWEVEYSQDDYNNTEIGLLKTDYLLVGLDLSILLSRDASFYASVYNEQIDNEQANSQNFSTADWQSKTDDTFTTATAGITKPGLLGPLDATLEYTWSLGVGAVNTDTSGLPNAFPDLRTKRQNVRVGLSYPYSKQLSFGFDYLFESLDSSDWALDGVNAATVPNLLALGADAWNYNASVFYLSIRYQLQPH